MLLITREVDYALRILRALSDGSRATAAEIARQEQVPQQFAYKILRKLAKSGFVSTSRGADGGYSLAADLQKRTLYDLTAVMDSLELVNACMQPGYRCAWRESHGQSCMIHTRLEAIQQAVNRELQAHSLASLLFEEG